ETRTPAFCVRIAATIASETRPESSTGPTSSGARRSASMQVPLQLDVHLDLSRHDPDVVAAEGHAVGVDPAAGGGVVGPLVRGAHQAVAGQLPLAERKRAVEAP